MALLMILQKSLLIIFLIILQKSLHIILQKLGNSRNWVNFLPGKIHGMILGHGFHCNTWAGKIGRCARNCPGELKRKNSLYDTLCG